MRGMPKIKAPRGKLKPHKRNTKKEANGVGERNREGRENGRGEEEKCD